MKGFLEKYRNISVWLSLFILAMWFVGASDQENRMPCMLLAFLAEPVFSDQVLPGSGRWTTGWEALSMLY